MIANYSHLDSLSALSIIELLQQQKLKPVEALAHFFYKSARIDLQTNAVMDFCPESVEQALKFDDYSKPLAGLPISMKETFFMKGYPTSHGYLPHMDDEITEKDCVLVELLRDLGAIFFVRTTVPETCAS